MEQHHIENASPRPSHLRPPSKIPAVPRQLHEVSDNESNARAMLPPPPPTLANAMKHKPSNLPEPAPKRKTLAERAGEVAWPLPSAPPSSRPVNGSVRALAAAGIRHQTSAQPGHSRSTSSASTNYSRIHSGSSMFNGSIGSSGTRAPSSQSSYRPASAMSHTRTGSRTMTRTAPSYEYHAGVDDYSRPEIQKAWDPDEFAQGMKQQLLDFEKSMAKAIPDRNNLQEQTDMFRIRLVELEASCARLSSTNDNLRTTNRNLQDSNDCLTRTVNVVQDARDKARDELQQVQSELEELTRQHKHEMEDLVREHRGDVRDLQGELSKAIESSKRKADEQSRTSQKAHQDELEELQRRSRAEIDEERTRRVREVEEEQIRRAREVNELSEQLKSYREDAEATGVSKEKQLQELQTRLDALQIDLERERTAKNDMTAKLADSTTNNASLQAMLQAARENIHYLASDKQAQSEEYATMKRREEEAIAACEEAQAKLRQEESLRRKLHNQVQELKGNIRVFCRVRPPLPSDGEGDGCEAAKITFPDADEDSKEVVVQGPETKSALGNITTAKNPFTFDRVFGPTSQNAEIFDEISQLVQSALDGYNVCIFCYGQTGSGKTYTMSSETNGMIPLAVQQIFNTAASLEEKGWSYTMTGSFVEVYNENYNDLLGSAKDLDKKDIEVHHDPATASTTLKNAASMTLDSPDQLDALLKKAAKNRSVAATKANERSSRSHSVFILRLHGTNAMTNESSAGTLNLVDLAGSERLSHSGATGDRLTETKNINKSLSCLGDVIGALGGGKKGSETHVPYRNSKLTYLLQYSLGGNSKTLMFVMVSPLARHLGETITSLRFATKVHNTHIGTAKRQARVA